jgi:O-antigen/teichoic acid export membrane protein
VNKTASNLFYFSIAVVLVKIIGALTTFIVARVLSPGDFGIWVTLLVVGSFSSIICLGTLESLIKLFPFYTGKGEAAKALNLESGVLGSIVIAAAVLCAAGATFHFFVATGPLVPFIPYIRIMAASSALGVFSAFFYHRFMAHQDFKFVSAIDSMRSVSMFIFIVPFSWFWGLTGAVAAIAFNEAVMLVISFLVNKRTLGSVRPQFKPGQLADLVRIGFPITIIWWTYMFQTTIDRVLSISLLGKDQAGYYGLGASIVSALVLIPMVLGRVLYPKVNEEIGKNAGQTELLSYVIMPAQALAILLPVIIGTIVIAIPDLYRLLFAKYVPGILSAQVLLLGAYFVCLIRSGVNYLVAIDRQNRVLAYAAASLVVNVGLSVALVKLGFGILGISMGMALSGAVLATLLWKSVFKQLGYTFKKQVAGVYNLYLPFLICCALIGLAAWAMRPAPQAFGVLIRSGCAALFLILYGLAVATIPPLNSWTKALFGRIKPIIMPVRTVS